MPFISILRVRKAIPVIRSLGIAPRVRQGQDHQMAHQQMRWLNGSGFKPSPDGLPGEESAPLVNRRRITLL